MTLLTSAAFASWSQIPAYSRRFQSSVCAHPVFRGVLGSWAASENKLRANGGQFVHPYGNQVNLTSIRASASCAAETGCDSVFSGVFPVFPQGRACIVAEIFSGRSPLWESCAKLCCHIHRHRHLAGFPKCYCVSSVGLHPLIHLPCGPEVGLVAALRLREPPGAHNSIQ